MKKVFFLSAMSVFLLLTAIQCDNKDNETKLNPRNVHHSKCLFHTDADAKYLEDPDSVDVEYVNGTVHVTHYNLLVNCGTAQIEGGINVTCIRNGSTIDIYEREDENNPQANCICVVNNEFDINGLKSGTYTFVFHSWYPEPQSFNYTF